MTRVRPLVRASCGGGLVFVALLLAGCGSTPIDKSSPAYLGGFTLAQTETISGKPAKTAIETCKNAPQSAKAAGKPLPEFVSELIGEVIPASLNSLTHQQETEWDQGCEDGAG